MKTKNKNLEFRNQNLDNNLSAKSYSLNSIRGFTLIEIIFAVAILSLILVAVGAFQRDVFYFNDILQTGLTNVTEARKVIRPFVNEVRSAEQSDLGAFAIAEASATSFAFYVDIDSDGSRERVRYFLDNDEFKKGIIEPSGNPPIYNLSNEKIIKVVRDVVASSTAFSYYDSSYNGTVSTSPLVQPVTTSQIRLVKIDLTVDANPNRAPSLLKITTQATIRNLKDNYDDGASEEVVSEGGAGGGGFIASISNDYVANDGSTITGWGDWFDFRGSIQNSLTGFPVNNGDTAEIIEGNLDSAMNTSGSVVTLDGGNQITIIIPSSTDTDQSGKPDYPGFDGSEDIFDLFSNATYQSVAFF